MSLQHQLAPTDQMFHKSSSVTSISDFKLQILMKPTTVSQIRSNNPGTSNCGLPQCITASLYCTAAQWSHLLLLQSPCLFFCLFLSVSVCLSDVFTRSYTADACTMQPSGKNSHIIPFFFYDGVTMMFAMIIMVVILMIMIAKITKNIQIL